jgi:hypothetical protein
LCKQTTSPEVIVAPEKSLQQELCMQGIPTGTTPALHRNAVIFFVGPPLHFVGRCLL